MKTILYLSATGSISGAERSLLALLDALDRDRWRPVVATPEGDVSRETLARHIALLPVPLAPLSRPHSLRDGLSTLRALRAGRRTVSHIVRDLQPDLLHANTTSAMLYAAHLAELPLIWQVRDLVPLGIVGSRLYRCAARVAAISTAVRDDLLRYADDGGKKITILPPAVDTDRFQPVEDRAALRAELGLPVGMPLIGLVAQFVPWKRHHLFLDALEQITDRPWHAVLAGANLHEDTVYPDTLRTRLSQPPFAGRSTLLHWQPEPQILMAALDLCVLTSEHEPFGRVLIEAMACGTTTVAVDAGGARDIILPEQTGLLTTADPATLATAIARLLDDEALRRRYGQAGRARAVAEFSLPRQQETLNTLYGSLLP